MKIANNTIFLWGVAVFWSMFLFMSNSMGSCFGSYCKKSLVRERVKPSNSQNVSTAEFYSACFVEFEEAHNNGVCLPYVKNLIHQRKLFLHKKGQDYIRLSEIITDMRDQNGKSLLMVAAKIGCGACIKYLIQLMNSSKLVDYADEIIWKTYFSARDNDGVSAIQYAARSLSGIDQMGRINQANYDNFPYDNQLWCVNILFFVIHELNSVNYFLGCPLKPSNNDL